MTAPYLSPRFHPTPEAAAAVELEVRVGSARPARYPFPGLEFRVGGATGSDLRLTGAHLPAHICRLVKEADGELQFYRVDPAFPLLADGRRVGDAPVRLRHGDRVAIGPLDLTVHYADVHLRPQLEAGGPTKSVADPAVVERDRLAAEVEALRAEAGRLAAQLPDLDARRDELELVRGELELVRERLHGEYQERRGELERERAELAAAAGALEAGRAEFEARRAEFEAEVQSHRERAAAEPDGWVERVASLVAREAAADATDAGLAEREAALAAREATLADRAADLEARLASVESESQALEAHARGVVAEAARLEALALDLVAREGRHAEREAELAAREAQSADAAARNLVVADRVAELDAREANLDRQGQKLREVGRAVVAAKRESHAAREALAAERAAHAEATARARAGLDELRRQLEPLQADAAAARDSLANEAASLDRREEALEAAATEHRLAVAGFRQQVIAWQQEADARPVHPEPAPAAPSVLAARAEVPLSGLREWYRRRLRDVAAPSLASAAAPSGPPDPGDRQLAARLVALELADADVVDALLAEAQRVRRPLRAVLLTGGAATLYQLAMIESGNLEALALGRLRVIDRVRVTPREVVYRVSDPNRAEGPNRGVYLLRHLAEAEMDDAVRPDEFRQRFGAAREATHLHLAQVAEVLEINGRPAALCEQPAGSASHDWPAEAAHPGVWVRLLEGAAAGLAAAHRHGLTHGRLSSESFVLTPEGELKVVGVGEPMWLSTGVAAALEPTPAADLRALGPVSFGWAQLAQPPGKRRTRGKAFPEPLLNVVRRLESDPETPMADTASGATPYEGAAELLSDLARLAAQYPCPAAEWDRVVSHAAARPDGFRQSA